MESKKKKRLILSIILIVVLIIILLFSLKSRQNNAPPDKEIIEESEEPKSLDFEAANEQEKITIPAVTGLNMVSGQLNQNVDFYNPNTNCVFQLSLYLSDDTLLYQSDFLNPSECISEIELSQELKRGTYKNCRLVFDCFTLTETKEPLNSGTVIMEITAR